MSREVTNAFAPSSSDAEFVSVRDFGLLVKSLCHTCLLLLLSASPGLSQTNPPLRLLQPDAAQSSNSFRIPGAALRERAIAQYENQDYESARKGFSEILEQDPTDSDSAWRLGCCCSALKDYSAAALAFARYVKLRPESPEGHQWLGSFLSRLNKFPEAERELGIAIRLKPDYADAYDELGYLFEARGDNEKAAAAFDKAIKLGGETAERCVRAGSAYAHQKNYRQAVLLLERALKIEPGDVFAAQWLGYSQFYLGEYPRALATFTNALAVEPTNFFLRSWIGHTYLRLKKYDLAADSFARAAEIKPGALESRESEAFALIEGHRVDEAVKLLEQCVSQYPGKRSLRVTLLAACLMNNDYKKASKLYPVIFPITTIILAAGFVIGSILLLRKSFKPSTGEYPHLAFSIGWLVLFFETQLALVFFAGLFTSFKLLAGVLLAPIPLLIAALVAFPKQPWGQPFKRRSTSWKHIGLSALGWIAAALIAAAYSTAMRSLVHAKMEPRNIRYVLELVHEHRALAAFIIVILAPLTEEILFRGLLYGSLSKWLKPVWTVLITAALFAAIHMDLYFFFPLFLIGVLLGWARHATKAIWLPMRIHVVQNAIAFTIWMGM